MLYVNIREDRLAEVIRGKVEDRAVKSFGTNGGTNNFIMESLDSISFENLAYTVIKKLLEQELINKDACLDMYNVARRLYEDTPSVLEFEESEEDDNDIDYFDFDNIEEIDDIIDEVVSDTYDDMNLSEKVDKAYNDYIRTEVEGYDSEDDDY